MNNHENRKKNRKLKWIAEHILPYLIIPIIVYLINVRIINPPPLPHIKSEVVYSTRTLSEQPKGPFKLDFKKKIPPYFLISIVNDGNNYAEDLEIEVRFKKNMEIINTKKKYNPESLLRRVINTDININIFYEILSSMPSDSNIGYSFRLNDFINTSNDFKHSVCSRSKNWTKWTRIKPQYFNLTKILANNAFAEEVYSNRDSAILPVAGILIGGYDPLIMSYELFILTQKKNLISKEDAQEIGKLFESYKEGFIFGGLDILEINNVIMNKLISNKSITDKGQPSLTLKGPSIVDTF
jgi:hypothetical protein